MSRQRGYWHHDDRLGLTVEILLDDSVVPLPTHAFARNELVDYERAVISTSNNPDPNKVVVPGPIILVPSEGPNSSKWRKIKLRFTCNRYSELKTLVPPSERNDQPIEFSVSCRCPKTALRINVPLAEDPASSGRMVGELELTRGQVLGLINIDAKVTRSIDSPKGTKVEYAQNKRAILATSSVFKVHTDLPKSRGDKLIVYKMVNFETWSNGRLAEFKRELFYLDLTHDDRVECYVNLGSTQWVQSIEGTKGGRYGKVRDAMNSSLVSQVLQAVYIYAVSVNSESSWDEIKSSDGWQRHALEALGKVADPDDLSLWIDTSLQAMESREAGDMNQLLATITWVIQKQMKMRQYGEKLTDVLLLGRN